MEAAILKTSIEKEKLREQHQAKAEAKHWQKEAGVKTVTAKPPEGGW